MDKMRTIRVTGKGQVSLKPDMTRIYMTLNGLYINYAETLKHSSEDTDKLKELLAGYGFQRQDLKTVDFDVNTEYEGYQEDGIYKQRFVGYRYRHELKVEFDSDNELLGRVLYGLANCELMPELRLGYTVRDQEAARNELLGKAVADAKEKAKVLTDAAGVQLKDIQSIDYSWGQMDIEIMPMRAMMPKGVNAECSDGYFSMDIEPDNINIQDNVTVVWEIA